MANNIGIWVDLREAYIIRAEGREVLHHLRSEVEEKSLGGGYGGSTRYLGQDASSESMLTNRRNQQLETYFESIVRHLPDLDGLYIMGPGEVKNRLHNHIKSDKKLIEKVVAVEAADSLSLNKLRERVDHFFTEKES